jgi:hypothetical protein
MIAEMREFFTLTPKKALASKPPLLAALESLDITPFNRSAVEEYKQKQLNETFETQAQKFEAEGWQRLFSEHTEQYPITTILSGRWLNNLDAVRYGYFFPPSRLRNLNGTPPKVFALKWFRMSIGMCEGFPAWQHTDMSNGVVDVPEYVTRKIDQIKERVPGATFEADALMGVESSYDPFLIVKLGDEEYYVEVWGDDEKFHA